MYVPTYVRMLNTNRKTPNCKNTYPNPWIKSEKRKEITTKAKKQRTEVD